MKNMGEVSPLMEYRQVCSNGEGYGLSVPIEGYGGIQVFSMRKGAGKYKSSP
jgi:hypothetical protein